MRRVQIAGDVVGHGPIAAQAFFGVGNLQGPRGR